MRKILFALIPIFSMVNVFGQKTEYSVALNSGLFSFSGKSVQSTTFMIRSDNLKITYTNNPYGSQKGLCYGLSGNVKRVSKKGFIVGFDLGFEQLRSKISIDAISGNTGTSTYQYAATGKTFTEFNFINLRPFIGYRLAAKSLNFDISVGFDVGFCLKAKEDGSASATNGTNYKTSTARKMITTDIRPGLQLAVGYKKFGIYTGYYWGLKNYKAGYIGGTNDAYSRLLRFGVSYLLK